MSEKSRGPVFQAGRDQHIAYAEQGPATLHAHVSNIETPGEIDIAAELRAVREIITRAAPHNAPSIALLDSAEQEATSPEPRRDQVANLVEGATKLVAGVDGFAQHADSLIPRLQVIAKWAGHAWDAWAPSLGL